MKHMLMVCYQTKRDLLRTVFRPAVSD